MKITVEGHEYDYDPDTLRNDEIMALEAALGVTFKQWSQLMIDGSISALTGLVWLVQRREEPGLRFDDVKFAVGALEVEGQDDPPTEPASS